MSSKLLHVSEVTQKGRIELTVSYETRAGSGKRKYNVPVSIYEKIGSPAVGNELDESEVAILKKSVERSEAAAQAVKILSYGDNNSAMLYRKLRERGHSEEAAKYAVGRMVARGYIKELDQIERLAAGYAKRKLWGRRKISLHLLAKGYDAHDIDKVIRALEVSGDINFEENFERLLSETVGSKPTSAEIRELKYKYGYEN